MEDRDCKYILDEILKMTDDGFLIVDKNGIDVYKRQIVGMLIPGADAIYCGQTLKFTAPVYFGDTITAEAEVTKIIPEKRMKMCIRDRCYGTCFKSRSSYHRPYT